MYNIFRKLNPINKENPSQKPEEDYSAFGLTKKGREKTQTNYIIDEITEIR